MSKEVWVSVPGFSDYVASTNGRIKRRTWSRRAPDGFILKARKTKDGYLCLNLNKNGKSTTFLVHKIIALTFLGSKPTKKHEIAHWDGCRTTNRISNLRWSTRKENDNDMDRHKTRLRGERHPNFTLTDKQIVAIRRMHIAGFTYPELSAKFGAHASYIGQLCRMERRK